LRVLGSPRRSWCFQATTAHAAANLHLRPDTHNLEDLAPLCLAKCPNLDLEHVDVTELTPFAVEMRYDFEFWPSRNTAQDALDLPLEVRRAILALIPSDAKP
jgi:hypothetical protein